MFDFGSYMASGAIGAVAGILIALVLVFLKNRKK